MPKGRACSICIRSDRDVIDNELIRRGKQPKSAQLAKAFGLSTSAVQRHRQHISADTVLALRQRGDDAMQDPGQPNDLLDELRDIKRLLVKVADHAFRSKQLHAVIGALGKRLDVAMAEARLIGAISDRPEHKHLHVHVTEEQALRVAETYVARHKQLPQS